MDEQDLPDNFWDKMPPRTYCKCAESWVDLSSTLGANVQVSVRMKCPACGHWTDAVPVSKK